MYDNARFLSNEASHDFAALLKEAISLIGSGDPQTRCQILSRLVRAHLVLGDADGASLYQQEAAEEAHRLNHSISRFDLLVNRFLIPGRHPGKTRVTGARTWMNSSGPPTRWMMTTHVDVRSASTSIYLRNSATASVWIERSTI